MKRKKQVLVFVAALLFVLLTAQAFAEEAAENKGAGVDFGLEGYYRVRYDNMFNTEWAYDDDSDWWTYWDQRMLLKSTLTINEKVSIKMDLDFLKDVNWGQNSRAILPAASVERNPADLEQIEDVSVDLIELQKGNILSQEMGTTNVITGEEVDPIQVRRLYGEVLLPIGRLRVGRQGSDFGMGIFSNSGDGYDDDYGDTYDRILFGTKIGPYIPVFIYDKVVEGNYKVADTDVNQFVWANYVRDIRWGNDNSFDAGLYLMHRNQQSTDARVFAYDFWFRFMFGGFRLESETVALQGKLTFFDRDTIEDLEENGLPTGQGGGKITADAYIGANQFWYEDDQWGVGGEFGFSSPADPDSEKEFNFTSASNIAVASALHDADEDSPQATIDFINAVVQNQGAFGNHLYTFAFDKDYSVDLIIWETLMGGAVKNGIYAKVGGYVNPLDLFQIRLDLVKSWINESGKGKDGTDADHDLGWELDTDFNFTTAEHFTFGLQFGWAFPGKYFDDVYDGVENVFTMQSRFVFHF